jgi:16S rRNA (guanine966-N2)-methyltransferase
MKIIAGSLGGRSIARPMRDTVRPMSQKVRGALFDALGDMTGLSVADVYAGSGAAGLEAASRGARSVVLVEGNRKIASIIDGNVKSLGLSSVCSVVVMKAELCARNSTEMDLDLIIADPPYDSLDMAVVLLLSRLLVVGGLLVLSHTSRIQAGAVESMELLRSRAYGDSTLSFWRRME